MHDIVIAGLGIVGTELYRFFNEEADIYDPIKGYHLNKDHHYSFAFIAVPTDNFNNECDTSHVKACIDTINADIYIIKSTIPVGLTDELIASTHKNIVFSPEYFGNTKNNKGLNQHFVILGGCKKLTQQVAQLYMKHTPSNYIIRTTDSKTAETVKYMENAFIAHKVVFMNEFYRISNIFDLDFQEVRSLFLLDERFSPYFTYVFEDQPYYDSHCLNKDIPALVTHLDKNHQYQAELLQAIIDINEKYKNKN